MAERQELAERLRTMRRSCVTATPEWNALSEAADQIESDQRASVEEETRKRTLEELSVSGSISEALYQMVREDGAKEERERAEHLRAVVEGLVEAVGKEVADLRAIEQANRRELAAWPNAPDAPREKGRADLATFTAGHLEAALKQAKEALGGEHG